MNVLKISFDAVVEREFLEALEEISLDYRVASNLYNLPISEQLGKKRYESYQLPSNHCN